MMEQTNSSARLDTKDLFDLLRDNWTGSNTAILVIHGIGHQYPLETIDAFTRGTCAMLKEAGVGFVLEHRLAKKESSDSGAPWFDNYIRIKKHSPGEGEPAFIDIYEYYWAPQTEGKATFEDLNKWINGVTRGARKFYKDNMDLAVANRDNSAFVRNGKFNSFNYWLFVNLLPMMVTYTDQLVKGLLQLIYFIPVAGPLISNLLKFVLRAGSNFFDSVTNILNDIAIYNTSDAKSRFFKIRNCILDGAVNAFRYLLEICDKDERGRSSFRYDKIVLCGHSLGSQIAFDTMNRLNHLVNRGQIKGYDQSGACCIDVQNPGKLAGRIRGFVTFGSPLDKIAFFFRDQTERSQWIRAQLLTHFHSFKQRKWQTVNSTDNPVVNFSETRLFDDVEWRNYYDKRDYVSGCLDYYENVVNVDCCFNSGWAAFTHGRYWDSTGMYADIFYRMILNQKNKI